MCLDVVGGGVVWCVVWCGMVWCDNVFEVSLSFLCPRKGWLLLLLLLLSSSSVLLGVVDVRGGGLAAPKTRGTVTCRRSATVVALVIY